MINPVLPEISLYRKNETEGKPFIWEGRGGRMRIGFIGAGRVGCSLGKYFLIHGLKVSGYYSRTFESAHFAAEFTETIGYETLEELADSSDILFLTVSDSAVEQVWQTLKQLKVQGKIICHCSGVLSSSVFSGIDQVGAFGYSIHPIYAINSKTTSYKELERAHFTIEGSGKKLPQMKALIESMGNPVTVIESKDKNKYHAACVISSNLVIALSSIAGRLLEECGFSKEEAEQALLPLFADNCKAVVEKGNAGALTGPVSRGDIQTLQRHLEVLDAKDRLWYLLLSRELVFLAGEKNPKMDLGAMQNFIRKEVEKNYEKHSDNI